MYLLCVVLSLVLCKTLLALTLQFHAARDCSEALYKHLSPPWFVDEDSAPDEVPECETALTTLPAKGTAKHRLTPLQQAELERRQAEVAARRQAAARLAAEQAAQQAEKEAKDRRQKKIEERKATEAKVANAKERMRVVEARKQQKAAQEREASEQLKKAAKAAQDALR